ncbi:MAG: NAD(P)H-binding protein [Chromatiales bacterium]|nr:NAD(P)H-binding protein [Chromatiales bacterium]
MFRMLIVLLALAWLPAAAERGPVLVFGATGQLGAEVVRELVAAGYPVTAFVRPGSDRSRLEGLDIQYVTGDMLRADQVARALAARRYEAVIEASARGGAPDSFYPDVMRHVVAAAQAHGSPRIILHGSVGAGQNIEKFPQAPFGRMTTTLAAKGEAEALLIDSGLPYVIIRNGILMRDGTPATGHAYLSSNHALMRSVTRADLARLTVMCLRDRGCDGRIWHAVDDRLPFPDRYR